MKTPSLFKIFLQIFLLVFSTNVFSQEFEWVKTFGASGDDRSFSVTHDSKGNVYTTGYFRGNVDFDYGPNTFNLSSSGSSDAFITKYDKNGNFIWARKFSGSSEIRGLRIAVDELGNVYTTGSFEGSTDFNPGFASNILTASGNTDVFVSKLDSTGSYVWAKSFNGLAGSRGLGIEVDDEGNVYTTGFFQGNFDFDPDTSSYILSSGSSLGAFISKLDANGNFVLAKVIIGTGTTASYGLAIDSMKNIYTTGLFSGNVDFDPNSGSFILSSSGGRDVYISKLDSLGNFVWAKKVGGANDVTARLLKIGMGGDLYICGYFSGTANFNPDSSGTFNISASGVDVFILKLNNLGGLVWAKKLGGSGGDYCYAIDIDKDENVYTTGSFTGTADFDPGVSQQNLVSAGQSDIFVSKLDVSGNYVWAGRFGGNSDETATSISVDNEYNIYASGFFMGTVNFDPISSSSLVSSNGSNDIFNLKLYTCGDTITYDSTFICLGDTLIINDNKYFQSGLYIDTLISNRGCISIIETNLKVVDIDLSYDTISYSTPNLLRSNQSGAAYQWLDCNNGYQAISGETNQSFYIPATGDYALEIKFNGCIDTTTCINKILVGIQDLTIAENFNIYPNPSSGFFILELPYNGTIAIYNITGQLVSSNIYNKGTLNLNLSDLHEGIYLVRYILEEEIFTKKIIISN